MNAEMVTWRPWQGEEKSEPETREDNKIAEDHEQQQNKAKPVVTEAIRGQRYRSWPSHWLQVSLGRGSATYIIIIRKESCQIQGTELHQKPWRKTAQRVFIWFFLFIWTRFQHVALLTWNSLCRSGWLQIHRALSAANKVMCHHYACVAHCYLFLRQVLTMLSSSTPMLGFKGPSHLSLWKNWD